MSGRQYGFRRAYPREVAVSTVMNLTKSPLHTDGHTVLILDVQNAVLTIVTELKAHWLA